MMTSTMITPRVDLILAGLSVALIGVAPLRGVEPAPLGGEFLEKHCVECHDSETKKGGLDLTALKFDFGNPTNFSKWVLVHDRVAAGEMPPKKKAAPDPMELEAFTKSVASGLTAVEQERTAREGRATQRRLNRYEYENALRDLL